MSTDPLGHHRHRGRQGARRRAARRRRAGLRAGADAGRGRRRAARRPRPSAAATTAAAAHPCRLLVVVRRQVEADDRLDAEVQVGGRLGAGEAVVMRMYGRLDAARRVGRAAAARLRRPGRHLVARRAAGAARLRRARRARRPAGHRQLDRRRTRWRRCKQRAKDYAPGDTDLAWTRTTPWRALLAVGVRRPDRRRRPRPRSRPSAGNPSAALLAGWLTARLGVKVRAGRVRRAGHHRGRGPVRGRRQAADRPARTATSRRCRAPGMTDRQLPLKRRELGDLLAEELRRLDADQPYAEALAAATGEKDLDSRPPMREPRLARPGTGRHAAKRPPPRRRPPKKSSRRRPPPRRPTAKKATAKPAARRRPSTRKAQLVSTPTVLVHRDPDELAAAVAARLITRLVDVQSARGVASLVLTGGGIARTTLEAVA